jgi:hypothetical protein
MAERFRLFAAAATLLIGCGSDPQTGGGTELPSPIQVMIVRVSDGDSEPVTSDSENVLVAARQWRLWDVRTTEGDSILLESRGLLEDSSGVITLPPDSGTFLVEAWTTSTPPDSLDLRIRVAPSALPSASCLTTLAKGTEPTTVRSCVQGETNSPSFYSGNRDSNLPDVVSMVRIPGIPVHRFRILGVSGDTLPIGESRLWQLNAGDLSFRGIMRQNEEDFPDLPTLRTHQTFVLETWEQAGVASSRVAAKIDTALFGQAQRNCVVRMGDPLPDVLTLHACALAPLNLSGGTHAPDHWALLEYTP